MLFLGSEFLVNEAEGASLPDTRKWWEMERREADKLWDKPGLCGGVLLTSFPAAFISKHREHTFVLPTLFALFILMSGGRFPWWSVLSFRSDSY